MTPAELAAQNGHPIIPEDEAAEAFGFPSEKIIEVPPSQTPDA